MNDLKIIDQRELLNRDFRIYGSIDNPLFLAKDVASWIEHSQVSKMMLTVEEDEKVRNIIPTLGGNQEMWFLTEEGLYEVLMQSRKPIAKSFKKEVKKILKQIRKTGGYIPIEEEMSEAEIMAKALIISQRTIEQKDKLLKEKEVELVETKVELEDKNRFIGQISASNTSMLVRDVAHLVTKNNMKIGEKRLWSKLREWGLIFKESTKPKQRALEQGLFEVSQFAIQTNHGITTKATTRVTGKGQVYIIDRLLKEGI